MQSDAVKKVVIRSRYEAKMKLALKELKYNWKKYILIEIIVILMMFMVIFLSGLVKGLGSAVSSSVENMNATSFVVSDDSEKLLTVSNLSNKEYSAVKEKYGKNQTPLNIQRTYIQKSKSGEKIDITYFGIDPDGFLAPEVYKGSKLAAGDSRVILNKDFQEKGIQKGDTILDSQTGMKLKVLGFTDNSMYGHISAGYISNKTFNQIMDKANPAYQNTVHAAAIRGSEKHQIAGTEVYSKDEIVKAIPGYQAEQMTITMVEWLLVVITALIIGIFFFVVNLQKEKEFGVLKAIGKSTGTISRMIMSQVFLVSTGGAVISALLVRLMSTALPSSMPFTLEGKQVALVLCAFIVISIIGSLATVIRAARIDPARIIGGDFQ